jgi:hypothetical protein
VPGRVDLETGVGAWRFGVANEQKSNFHRYQPHLSDLGPLAVSIVAWKYAEST